MTAAGWRPALAELVELVEKTRVKMELLPGPGFWRKPARTLGLGGFAEAGAGAGAGY